MENDAGMKLGKHENSEQNPKNPDIIHQNCPLASPRIESEPQQAQMSGSKSITTLILIEE